jgi:hypothetical protein
MDEPKLLFIAVSMIERDALKARLEAYGVEAVSPKRDISRKYTENTVDLAFGGYSTLFDGFKIFVDERDFKKSEEILSEFSEMTKPVVIETEKSSYFKKFHYFSVASVFVPLVPLLFGIYYFYMGVKNKEKPRVLYTIFSFVLYLPQIGFFYMGLEKLKDYGVL